ncbi:MAG: XylR N-terminal domain-containing protein [Polyangiaceae bacterium]|nr:XylR N-terminal domain-containing protein [Polyangiaceae bacterium]NUQ74258.1 XylR N-terminal domain-containing protein [Polyangiaceae bacterium]
MKASDIDLRSMLSFRHNEGRLLFGRERMLIFRQDSFAILRRGLIDGIGAKMARSLLAQFGYRCGLGDHRALASMFAWDTDADELAAGPAMHMWEGIVRVERVRVEVDRPLGKLHIVSHWRNSFEAEIHQSEYGLATEPQCHTLAGYAAGWGSSFMSAGVLAVERQCAAAGAPFCTIEVRREEAWGPEADPWREALVSTPTSIKTSLEDERVSVDKRRTELHALTAPILSLWEGLIAMPIVGSLDPARAADTAEVLLRRIVKERARCVLLDVTGMRSFDATEARRIEAMIAGAALLGAHVVLTGVNPGVAQSLAAARIDMGRASVRRTLKEGFVKGLQILGQRVR